MRRPAVPSRARVHVLARGGRGVGDELAVDGVGDPALEAPQGLEWLLALGALALVVGPPVGGQSELCDRGDVDHVVDPAVAGPGEAVSVVLPGGGVQGCGPVPGREAVAVGEAGGERPTHIQAAAVQRAATSLRRSVSRTVKDSIRRFASLHRMDAGWTAAAMRLINVRNKHLAHPGEPLSNADRDSLTKRSHGARETVLDAIRAVLNSDEAQGIPPAPVTEAAPRGDLTIRWKPGPMASWSPAPQPEQGGVDRCHDRPVKGAVLPRERDCDIGESFRRERRDPPP